jgi:hypothetical protein
MRVVSLLYAEFLSPTDLERHECSDRIWVPARMFERWMSEEDAGSVVLVTLDGVAACMYAPHREAHNVIYASTWMCEALRVSLDPPMDDDPDDYIVPVRIRPAVCTFMRIQPHTSTHLMGSSGAAPEAPEDVLSHGFEQYTSVRSGQTLTLQLENGERMFVTVVDAEPATGAAVCIRSPEITMDLLEPLDAEPVARAPTPRPVVDIPVLYPPGGSPIQTPHTTPSPTPTPPLPSREERRRLAAEAAMRRFQS